MSSDAYRIRKLTVYSEKDVLFIVSSEGVGQQKDRQRELA